jgi:YD repeat-containing protein
LNIAYDANGNTLSDAQGRTFTWDFESRLTQATNPGVGTTTFRYDPFGNGQPIPAAVRMRFTESVARLLPLLRTKSFIL